MIFMIGVLGLVFGSFVTAFVHRLQDGRDWVRGRSSCDNCDTTLGPADLVPVLSWIASRGRCRHCSEGVSVQYPLIELTMSGLFVLSYHAWPYSFDGFDRVRFGVWLVSLVGLVALSVYDLRTLLIPNRIVYPLIALWTGFIALEAIFFDGGPELVRNAVLGLLGCGGVFYAIFQFSGGRWIGGGDVKLGFLLGLMAGGAFESMMLIMLASFIGLGITLPLMLAKKIGPKSQIPFGPILVIAGIVVFLYGEPLLDWYLEQTSLV